VIAPLGTGTIIAALHHQIFKVITLSPFRLFNLIRTNHHPESQPRQARTNASTTAVTTQPNKQ
jgi:hypothetical protein